MPSSACDVVLSFWWSCRGNLKLITHVCFQDMSSVSFTAYQNYTAAPLITKKVAVRKQGKRWSALDQEKLADPSNEWMSKKDITQWQKLNVQCWVQARSAPQLFKHCSSQDMETYPKIMWEDALPYILLVFHAPSSVPCMAPLVGFITLYQTCRFVPHWKCYACQSSRWINEID